MAQAALDAFLRVDLGDDLVLQIEILPVRNIGNRQALEIADPGIALFIHPAAEAVDHVVNDAEAVMHGRRANLHAAGAKRDEFGGVATALYAAAAGNRDDDGDRKRTVEGKGGYVHVEPGGRRFLKKKK